MIRIRYTAGAKADLRHELRYYDEIRPDLGDRFLAAVERAVEALASHPLAMQVVQNEVRRWPVMGFPHGVLYRVEPEVIYILAVFHPKQHPAQWQQRPENS